MPIVIKYVPDRYKTKEMCDKVIIEKYGMLGFIHDCYKNQKMCDKAADNCSHALRFISYCYETQKMFNRAVVTRLFVFDFILFDSYMALDNDNSDDYVPEAINHVRLMA